jgi:hypothetical protein
MAPFAEGARMDLDCESMLLGHAPNMARLPNAFQNRQPGQISD